MVPSVLLLGHPCVLPHAPRPACERGRCREAHSTSSWWTHLHVCWELEWWSSSWTACYPVEAQKGFQYQKAKGGVDTRDGQQSTPQQYSAVINDRWVLPQINNWYTYMNLPTENRIFWKSQILRGEKGGSLLGHLQWKWTHWKLSASLFI